MSKIKKTMALLLAGAMTMTALVGCGKGTGKEISVLSREEGSGTRGAFIELFKIQEKDANGEKVDHTTTEAGITNSTSVMMTTVAGDENAIGYISLGSLNDTVKALEIDGTKASIDNIKNDTYKIARPFNLATKDTINEQTKDFIKYVMSAQGQAIIEKTGYVSVSSGEEYSPANQKGKITIAGSSSVTPVMEKLKEAYIEINSGTEIEIQENDSTTGMKSAIDGICDIGMASRELTDSETKAGLTKTVVAMDGIAVIVNKASETSQVTSQQVKSIFTGETTDWDNLKK